RPAQPVEMGRLPDPLRPLRRALPRPDQLSRQDPQGLDEAHGVVDPRDLPGRRDVQHLAGEEGYAGRSTPATRAAPALDADCGDWCRWCVCLVLPQELPDGEADPDP